MSSASCTTWQWTLADDDGESCVWQPIGESEATLLEHAYLQSWDRLELTLNGRPYVVDPFFCDADANFAIPTGEHDGPGILISRLPQADTDDPQVPCSVKQLSTVVRVLPSLELAGTDNQVTNTVKSGLHWRSDSHTENYNEGDPAEWISSIESKPAVRGHSLTAPLAAATVLAHLRRG